MPLPAPAACRDTGWSALRVTGADAVDFLHGQLSSDVRSLAPGAGQYWTYNSPKGRTLASGVLWRSPAGDAVTMLLAADLAAAIRKRLSMFVLRAKATIDDGGPATTVIGIAGAGAADAAHEAFGVSLEPARAVALRGDAHAFMLPDRRIAIVAPVPEAAVLQAALVRHAPWVRNDEWRWFGIAAGVPWIGAATTELFIPQALNFDLLGGVSFTKGCYPGQEIVARMQYLGRLKERLFAFHSQALEASPAMRLYSASFDSSQPCGTVVDATADARGGISLLAVAQIAAALAGDITLGAPDGPPLVRRQLPYPVPAEGPRARPSV